MSLRARALAFAALCGAVAILGIGYYAYATGRAEVSATVPAAGRATMEDVAAGSHVLFRTTALGDDYGRVGAAPLDDPAEARASAPLECERIDYSGERGICLQADRGAITTYRAVLFDGQLRVLESFSIAGSPSRTRISPDGSLAAYTVFVTGHSYAQGGFSTRTAIVDTDSGRELAELEKFTVTRDGEAFESVDFNFWGVTFAGNDGDFYATLGTGGKTFLVEGDLQAKTLTVVREGVECPSLSPDGTRIAFKQRSDDALGPVTWHVAVLDLASGQVTRLTETRSVDDQVEWLDDDTVLYGLVDEASGGAVTDVWRVPADGAGEPEPYVRGAWSPVVVP